MHGVIGDNCLEALVDTDVLSFLLNEDPIRAPRYEPHIQGRVLCVSFISAAEMWLGAEHRGSGSARRERLDLFLQHYVVLESTPRIGATWAHIRAYTQRHGRSIERQDAWIAATAVALDLPLVIHNAAHFAQVPILRIISEPDS